MMPTSNDTKHTHNNLAEIYLCNSSPDNMTLNVTEM